MASSRKLSLLFLISIYTAGCTTDQLVMRKTNISAERAAWEKRQQQEREQQAEVIPAITPDITPVAENKVNPFGSRLDICDEQYEFFVSENIGYLRCRSRLHTGQNRPLKMFYFIVARNLDHKYKIQQVMPPEVYFDKQNKPNYNWGYEIEATDGMQLENLIPRPADQIHYNHLAYFFYDSQGQELLHYQVRLDYEESPYILKLMEHNKKGLQLPED